MPKSSIAVRVRFAPSPTGYLHIGGARTVLYNFLFAHKNRGEFLLRIEDTDQERSSHEMSEAILRSLNWLGLVWKGSPVYQSANRMRHLDICSQLLEKKMVYPCFCSQELLGEKRAMAEQSGQGFMYDRTCLGLSEADIRARMEQKEPYVLRFRVPDGSVRFHDLIRGDMEINTSEIDDFVLQRSDGSPVYQLAVVVDDHDMGITHVIRGDDHLSNTPKQILIYQALGWECPEFGHIPMILGPDKKRLSKRHGATSVEAYQEAGFLPEALVNFLALLGWAPGNDEEIMSLQTLIERFSLDRVSKSASVFDSDKLLWMNAQYLHQLSPEQLLPQIRTLLVDRKLITEDVKIDSAYLTRFIELMLTRVKLISEFADAGRYFFEDPTEFESEAVQKHWAKEGVSERLRLIEEKFSALDAWDEPSIETLLRSCAVELNIGAGKFIHSIRVALTGQAASPGLFEMMALMGKETVIRRLQTAILFIDKLAQ